MPDSDESTHLQQVITHELLAETQVPTAEAKHLPAHFYTSPEILELEKERLFFKDWLVVGRVEEWPNPGDYRALELFGEPIIIARNEAGELNAFANVCRHRGVAVASGEGNVRNFSCPYHAWVYDLTGSLVSASRPRGIMSVDARNCKLPPIRLDTWGGFVFINFDEHAPDLSEYLDVDGYRESTAYVHPEETVLVDTYHYELDCNWKLVPENLADIYHVEVIHAGSFGGDTYKPEKALAALTFTKHGWYKEYESGTMAPGAELLFGPAPWLANHEKGKLFAFSAFLRPNFYLFARADMIQPWVAYPISPTKTAVTGWTCLPKSFLDSPAFDEKVEILAKFARKFADEDIELMRAIQKGLTSRNFVRGPMHELESVVHHRINCYLNALKDGEAS
jgi:phenylpropionate dioxygenase-like ring-hydroxylating dioxygenase large terminal subunit